METFVECLEKDMVKGLEFEKSLVDLYRNNKASTHFVLLSKCLLLSIPGIESVLSKMAETFFSCKTIPDLYFFFMALEFEVYRSADVTYQDKLHFFRTFNAMYTNPFDPRDITPGELQQYTAQLIQLQALIRTQPCSEDDLRFFESTLVILEDMDNQQTIPLEQLLDPTFFPKEEDLNKATLVKKQQFVDDLAQAFPDARQEQLQRAFQALDKFGVSGWDKEFSLESLSFSQLRTLHSIFF